MKSNASKSYFTLIEIICCIVILAFALTSLVVAANQNIIKVLTSGAAVKGVLAAEAKLAEYRNKNWSEIPSSESGSLMGEDTESFQYEMASEPVQNEYGNFLHIMLTVTFPASNTTKKNGFILVTDIAVSPSDSKKMEDALMDSNLGIKK